jgi:hypothetical protein
MAVHPTEALKTALNHVKGQRVSNRDIVNATKDILTYYCDEFLEPDEDPPAFSTRGSMHAVQAVPQADIEAAFSRVMSPPPPKTKATAPKDQPPGAAAEPKAAATEAARTQATKLDWKTILQTLLAIVSGLIS